MREVESFERTRTTQLFRHGAPGGARQKEKRWQDLRFDTGGKSNQPSY